MMIKYRKKITITERKNQAPNERKFHKGKMLKIKREINRIFKLLRRFYKQWSPENQKKKRS